MGVCLHQDVTEEGKKAKLQSSKIEQDLCEHARTEMNVVKILMLGKWNYRNINTELNVYVKCLLCVCVCARSWREWKEHPHQTDQDNPQSRLLQTGAPQFQGISKSGQGISRSHLGQHELNDITGRPSPPLPFHSLRCWTTCWPPWSSCFEGWGCWGSTSQTRTTRWWVDGAVESWMFNTLIAAPF